MLPLPSASKLYEMAQNNGWGDTSMGESQWIANQKILMVVVGEEPYIIK